MNNRQGKIILVMDIEKFKCEKGILIDVVEEKVIKRKEGRD